MWKQKNVWQNSISQNAIAMAFVGRVKPCVISIYVDTNVRLPRVEFGYAVLMLFSLVYFSFFTSLPFVIHMTRRVFRVLVTHPIKTTDNIPPERNIHILPFSSQDVAQVSKNKGWE